MRNWLIALAVLAAFNVWMLSGIFAHEAPSGWAYDGDCCSKKDCAPIPDSDVADLGEGGFYIHSRREHIAFKDTRQGKDDQYHLCVNEATNARLCFYRKFNGS